MMFDTLVTTVPQLKAGKVRALAVTGEKRAPQAPDIPTLVEVGYTGYKVTAWQSIFAPAGTPRAIIDRLYQETAKALNMPDVPTLDEQGVRGYDIRAWTGLVAPVGTPAAILDRMNKEAVTALAAPEMKKRLYELSLVPIGDTREQFRGYLKSELAKWAQAVKVSGAKVE